MTRGVGRRFLGLKSKAALGVEAQLLPLLLPRFTERELVQENLNLKSGCRSRTRTYDPLINSQLLYLLSYAATRDTIIPLSIGAMSHGT
jgi:hypothetical protein